MGYAIKSKVYRLSSKSSQSQDVVQIEVTPHEDEDLDLIGLNVAENFLLSAEEDGNFCDAETSDPIAHLGTIILIPRLLGSLKFKLYQMDMKSASLNRDLNVEFEDFPFSNMMKRIIENLTKTCDKAS